VLEDVLLTNNRERGEEEEEKEKDRTRTEWREKQIVLFATMAPSVFAEAAACDTFFARVHVIITPLTTIRSRHSLANRLSHLPQQTNPHPTCHRPISGDYSVERAAQKI